MSARDLFAGRALAGGAVFGGLGALILLNASSPVAAWAGGVLMLGGLLVACLGAVIGVLGAGPETEERREKERKCDD